MAENLSLQNFDWDAYEAQKQGKQNEEEIQKYNETLNAIKDNEVVEGTVISINKREVVVNVGYKSDGIVPAAEFRYNPELKVGDKVEVYIQSQEDKKGQLVLSHKEARTARAWDRVNEAYNASTDTPADLSDGQYAWLDKDAALAYIEAAKEEGVEFPVHLDMLVEKYPFYSVFTTETDEYNLGHEITSVAVKCMLVCLDSFSEDEIYALTKSIYEHLGEIQEINSKANYMSLEDALSGIPSDLHPGALKYYEEQGLTIPDYLK